MVLKKYHIRCKFLGNKEFHETHSNSAIIRVDDPHHVLTMIPSKEIYDTDDEATINFTLKNQWGDPLKGTVDVDVTNPYGATESYTVSTDSNGKGELKLVCSIQGLWEFNATSKKTSTYTSGTANKLQLPIGKAYSRMELILPEKTVSGTGFKIQAKLSDESGNLINGKTIKFYKNEENVPFTTATTVRGIATVSTKVDEVGYTKFWCRFEEDYMYKTSRTLIKSIKVGARPVKLSVMNTILFPTWKFEVGIDDYLGNAVNNAKINVKLWNDSSTIFEGEITSKDGVASTPALQISKKGYIHYDLDFKGNRTHLASQIKDETKGVYAKLSQGAKIIPKTISNINTKAPYRGWSNLATAQVYNEGSYARCGTETSPIERKSLGFNTPASLRLDGLEIDIPEGSTITAIDVRLWLRGVGYNKVLPSFDAPHTNLKVQNKFSLISYGSDSIETSGRSATKIKNNSMHCIHCYYKNPNIGDTIIKSKDLVVDVIFPPNPTEVKGLIDMDYVDVLIEYIPKQVR